MEDIFSSSFRLKYIRQDIEEEYGKQKDMFIAKYLKFITIMIFISSTCTAIEISFFFYLWEKDNLKAVMITSYSIAFFV